MKRKIKGCTHYPSKQVQKLAGGGMVDMFKFNGVFNKIFNSPQVASRMYAKSPKMAAALGINNPNVAPPPSTSTAPTVNGTTYTSKYLKGGQ